MSVTIDIVKRREQRPSEGFKREKLHASVSAACLCVRTPEGQADLTASTVCEAVIAWLKTKPEVTSDDLRRKAAGAIMVLHPEAAYLYQHHRRVL